MDLECENWFLGQSYRICDYVTRYVLHDGLRTVEDIQAEIASARYNSSIPILLAVTINYRY